MFSGPLWMELWRGTMKCCSETGAGKEISKALIAQLGERQTEV